MSRGYTPLDLRILLLGAHYRSQMNFTWEALEQAKKNKEAIFGALERVENISGTQNQTGAFDGAEYLERLRSALSDDLNTSEALTVTLELVKKINTLLDEKEVVNRDVLKDVFEKMFFLFGLVREITAVPEDIETLAQKRETARKTKDFAESDRLRKLIEIQGWKIEDTPTGYSLKKS
jgi:cysteinyl-tRNA synthetase